MLKLVITIGALAWAQVATAAEPFNLTCSGTRTTTSRLGVETKPYSITYRINFDSGKWCQDDCKDVLPIASVESTRITFEDKTEDQALSKSTSNNWVDRTTGDQVILYSFIPTGTTPPVIMNAKGHCEKAAFTGFPTFATKF